MLRWTREEEFTWAYFRPAAVIDVEASLDDRGRLATWWHVNINAGGNSIDSPYDVERKAVAVGGLAAAAAARLVSGAGIDRQLVRARIVHGRDWRRAAGADPLEFRLAHLDDPRLRAVLEEAAQAIQLGGAGQAEAAESRRRPGVQHRQRFVRGLLRRSGGRSRRRRRSTCSTCASRSIAARC